MSSFHTKLRTTIAFALIVSATAHAADVTVQPAANSGFVVKDASGANERLRVQESGAVSLPGVPGATTQAMNLCMSGAGLLGPCTTNGSGSGTSYTAGAGMTLNGATFSVAPTYQLPQTCKADQVVQWNGTVWGCTALPSTGSTLPAGAVNQTLRYDGTVNAWAANGNLQAFADGGLVAGGIFGTGTIPTQGAGVGMIWYPAKAAFRAGGVTHGEWNDANIGPYSFAAGTNTTASGNAATAMGTGTSASDAGATALGYQTTASAIATTAMGYQTTASGWYATASGYQTTASGLYSTAIGSNSNAIGQNSFAIGDQLDANHNYCGIIGWQTTNYTRPGCVRNDEVLVSAFNGLEVHYGYSGLKEWVIIGASQVFAGQDIATGSGAYLSTAGLWTNNSDRNKKENFTPVDAQGVLDKVVRLPLTTWSYKSDHGQYRHLGPMAQDFYASFGLGQDDVSISTIDPAGVALAAIQGLNAKLEASNAAKDAEIAALRARLAEQDSRAETRNVRIAVLESSNRDLAEIKRQLAALRESVASPRGIHIALRP